MKKAKKKRESGKIYYQIVERAKVLGEQDFPGTPIRIMPYGQTTVKMDQIAERISRSTPLTKSDVISVITALEQQIGNEFLNGNRVMLDSLGTFSISLSIKDKDETGHRIEKKTLENLPSDTDIEINKILFDPAPNLKMRLKEATFANSGVPSSTKVDREEVEKWLHEWFQKNFLLTRHEFETHFNISQRNAQNILKSLVDAGELSAQGSIHTRCYILPEEKRRNELLNK